MLHRQRYFYTLLRSQTWRKYGDWWRDSELAHSSVFILGTMICRVNRLELDSPRFRGARINPPLAITEELTQTRKFRDQLMRQTVCERVVRKASARFLNGNTEIDGRCDSSMATSGFSVPLPGSTMLTLCVNRTSAIKRKPLP